MSQIYSELYPTTSAAEMVRGAANFVGVSPIFETRGGTKPGHAEFMHDLPAWVDVLESIRSAPGVSLDAWADFTLAGLKAKVPADLNIELEPFEDLGSVSRQVIISSWLRKATRFADGGYEPLVIARKWQGFKHLAFGFDLDVPQIEAFELSDEFQTPAFRMPVKEGGYIFLAQHNGPLTGHSIYEAAQKMVRATNQLKVESLVAPVTDVEIRGRLPWMEGLSFGSYRLYYAHYYAHLQMDENGSKDVQEVQGGFEKMALPLGRVHWVIDGPMVYVRQIGNTIVAPYYLGENAYVKV